jgi:hypothetical protein
MSDNFQFEPSSIVKAAEEVGKSAKRKMLSISARVFDPKGFLAPTTLRRLSTNSSGKKELIGMNVHLKKFKQAGNRS